MLYGIVDRSSEQYTKAFDEVVEATEELVMLELVDGTRLKDGASRIFFSDIKLSRKGQRKTIELKRQIKPKPIS
jgi:hypothetical protein